MINFAYVIPGLVRRYVPEGILFAIMARRGDGSLGEHDPDAYFQACSRRLALRKIDVAGKHVLEVGSGRYARAALRLIAAGARQVTLVDLYAEPLSEPQHAAMLTHDCGELGLDVQDACARIEVIRGDFAALPPHRTTMDLALSNAVLEHVKDPRAILARCYDWLRAGGVTFHFVDMRDHNLQFRFPFEMLTFSEQAWNTWFDLRGGFHLNRWRLPSYLDALRSTGFTDVDFDPFCIDAAGLLAVLPRFDAAFRAMPPDALAMVEIYLFGRKPISEGTVEGGL